MIIYNNFLVYYKITMIGPSKNFYEESDSEHSEKMEEKH